MYIQYLELRPPYSTTETVKNAVIVHTQLQRSFQQIYIQKNDFQCDSFLKKSCFRKIVADPVVACTGLYSMCTVLAGLLPQYPNWIELLVPLSNFLYKV